MKKVSDLLGIRIICLRLSDIKRVEAHLELLAEEKILRFIRRPDQKRPFVLPLEPGEAIPEGLDLRHSGYSSIHYQVELARIFHELSLRGLEDGRATGPTIAECRMRIENMLKSS